MFMIAFTYTHSYIGERTAMNIGLLVELVPLHNVDSMFKIIKDYSNYEIYSINQDKFKIAFEYYMMVVMKVVEYKSEYDMN